MSIDSTISRLSDNELIAWPTDETPELAVKYHKARQKRREAAHALIPAGAKYLPHNPPLLSLLNKLHINPRLTPGKYTNTFGKVLGGLEVMQVEAAFAPRNVKQTKKGGTHKTCHNNGQIFKVGYWGNALMLPYYWIPGQVANYQFIGRECRPDFDMPVKHVKPSKIYKPVGGLAYNPDLFQQDHNTVFAIEDMIIYLRFQASHYARGTDTALPLVTWFDDGEVRAKDAWSTFENYRKVFWCCDLTAGLLHQACLVNGDIALTNIVDKSEQGLRNFMQSRVQASLLKDFARQAQPWPQVLENWAERHTDRQVENLLRETQAKGTDITKLLNRCSRPLRLRCEAALAPVVAPKQVADGKRTIIDTAEGWYCRHGTTTTLISEAKLVIDQALYNPFDDAAYYCGRVVYKDQDIPFCEKRETVETDTLRWMQTYAVKAGIGLPNYDAKWRGNAVSVALQFKPAEIAEGLLAVGWDDEKRCFDFQNHQLDQFGACHPQTKRVIWPQTPANVLQPLALTPLDLEPLLDNTAENRLFWAFTAIQATSCLNPVFGYQEIGAALNIPDAGKMLNQIAQAAGCLTFPLTTKSLPEALEQEQRHRWPIAVGLVDKPQKQLLREYTEALSDRRCLVKANWWQVRTLVLQGWLGLETGCKTPLSLPALKLVPGILSTYLASLLSRNCAFVSKADRPLALVQDDLRYWLEDLNVDSTVLQESHRLFIAAESSFCDLLCSMLTDGYTQIVPAEFSPDSITRTGQELFIPQAVLLGFIDKKTGLDLAAETISQHAGALVSRKQIKGWLVPEKRLATQLAALRADSGNG